GDGRSDGDLPGRWERGGGHRRGPGVGVPRLQLRRQGGSALDGAPVAEAVGAVRETPAAVERPRIGQEASWFSEGRGKRSWVGEAMKLLFDVSRRGLRHLVLVTAAALLALVALVFLLRPGARVEAPEARPSPYARDA